MHSHARSHEQAVKNCAHSELKTKRIHVSTCCSRIRRSALALSFFLAHVEVLMHARCKARCAHLCGITTRKTVCLQAACRRCACDANIAHLTKWDQRGSSCQSFAQGADALPIRHRFFVADLTISDSCHTSNQALGSNNSRRFALANRCVATELTIKMRAQRNEAREIRTPNLLIWSQTRCHCAIAPCCLGEVNGHGAFNRAPSMQRMWQW